MRCRGQVAGLMVMGALLWFSVAYLTTPRRVARLMSELCRPSPGRTCYDPCCGSGRLPLAVQRAASRASSGRVRIFAQEINPIPFIAAAVNRRVHNLEMTLKRGSSLRHPAFRRAENELERFDLAIANPMWNQRVSRTIYRRDPFGRFVRGWPSRDGDWVWMQHMLAHLDDAGRMVVMLDRAATSRSSDPVEVQIRKSFVESDLIETVVLCPWEVSRPRWLVRTGLLKTPQAVLFVVNKAKQNAGEILFVDTRRLVTDYLSGILRADDVRKKIIDLLSGWTSVPPVAKVASGSDVVAFGFTLAPEVYCTTVDDVVPAPNPDRAQ